MEGSTLSASRRSAKGTVILPLNAKQGERTWYTVRLRVRITVRPGGADRGQAELLLATNGYGGALVTLDGRDDGVRTFHTGYLGGTVDRLDHGRTVHVDTENYVQLEGILGGKNILEVTLDGSPDLVERVEVLAETGLQSTKASPQQLSLKAPEAVRADAGGAFHVPFSIERKGERPDRPVNVTIEKAGGPIEFRAELAAFEKIGNGRNGTFVGSAGEPGTYEVKISAEGGYNEPFKIVALIVTEPAHGPDPGRLLAAAGLLAVAAVALGGVSQRAPRTRRQRS